MPTMLSFLLDKGKINFKLLTLVESMWVGGFELALGKPASRVTCESRARERRRGKRSGGN